MRWKASRCSEWVSKKTMTNKSIFLCTDLDRTLIPNGHQPESPGVRERFARLVARPEITLAYVSGRDKRLLLSAIQEWDLPIPDYAIGDVGTTIYRVSGGQWEAWQDWHEEIGPDWAGHDRDSLARLLEGFDQLTPQEPAKQNTFKLSYYTPSAVYGEQLVAAMQQHLAEQGVRASVIWSVDEMEDVGLVDVLPESATKMHAIRFLQSRLGAPEGRTVFAGDSGNDLAVLTSGLQAVLVANARDDVKRAARAQTREHHPQRLYIAAGDTLGMNGNYAAGILEGLIHFIPETRDWLLNDAD